MVRNRGLVTAWKQEKRRNESRTWRQGGIIKTSQNAKRQSLLLTWTARKQFFALRTGQEVGQSLYSEGATCAYLGSQAPPVWDSSQAGQPWRINADQKIESKQLVGD